VDQEISPPVAVFLINVLEPTHRCAHPYRFQWFGALRYALSTGPFRRGATVKARSSTAGRAEALSNFANPVALAQELQHAGWPEAQDIFRCQKRSRDRSPNSCRRGSLLRPVTCLG